MATMDSETKIISLELSDGTVVKVEATPLGEQRVALQKRPFKEAISQIKSIASEIAESLQELKQEVKPTKASIKLGLEIAIESGQLTTVIVKGSSKANLEVTLEWGE